jgi:hypothetical protein
MTDREKRRLAAQKEPPARCDDIGERPGYLAERQGLKASTVALGFQPQWRRMTPPPPPADPRTLPPEVLADAGAEMKRILGRQPQLTDFGFGVYEARRKTAAESAAELARGRDSIGSPRSLAGFVAARAWLSRYNKIKTPSKRGTSYGLKHIAAKEIGYTTNGVFIAAAIAEGFRVVRDRDTPNALLNISAAAWNWDRPCGPYTYNKASTASRRSRRV